MHKHLSALSGECTEENGSFQPLEVEAVVRQRFSALSKCQIFFSASEHSFETSGCGTDISASRRCQDMLLHSGLHAGQRDPALGASLHTRFVGNGPAKIRGCCSICGRLRIFQSGTHTSFAAKTLRKRRVARLEGGHDARN